MDYNCFGSLTRISIFTIFLAILLSSFNFTFTESYDTQDPNGNITIKWDVISWTPDGYVAVVTIYNFQEYRYIASPGWTLSWTWANKEVIWSMFGGQAIEQGNCSGYKSAQPHSCKKTPTVVDLPPGVPYNQQIANCCKSGVVSVRGLDPNNYISSFQISVGEAGNTNNKVKVPKNFTLLAPGPGYACGPVVVSKQPTRFITPDGRRVTQAMMTWNVTCTYSQFLAGKPPACCSSLFSSYNGTFVPCSTCTCGCRNVTHAGSCIKNSSNFNGDNCAMPPAYAPNQDLPNVTSRLSFSILALLTTCLNFFFVFV